jgi:mono/diheme cytochrome c family protein
MKCRIAVIILVISAATAGGSRSVLRADQEAGSQPAAATEPSDFPDSVWDGIYTEEQAKRGSIIYSRSCAACHMQDLSGGEIAPALNTLEFRWRWNGLTMSDLFERIRTTMPQDSPGSLSRQDTADVLALMLSKSDFPAGSRELRREAELLKGIRFEAIKP